MTNKPHDALFKAAFEHPEHAAGLLESILPATLSSAIAWPTITHEAGSFIDAELADHHTDLLFSVETKGARAFLYLLLEHQSTNDRQMPLRMLVYLTRIWERFHKQSSGDLPRIIPVLISNVPGGWAAPRAFGELFAPHPEELSDLERFTPDFDLVILDLAHLSNDDIKARALAVFPTLALWILRDGRDMKEVMENLAEWAQALHEAARTPDGMEALTVVFRYLALVSDGFSWSEFRAKLHEVAPEAEEAVMTIAEQLIAQGEAKGRVEGQVSLLTKLLTLKFGEIPPHRRTRMESASLAELDVWAERVLSATTLDEVFAE